MTVPNVASLLVFSILLAVGQLLFKRSAVAIAGLGAGEMISALATSPTFYAALGLYGGSTLLWVWILTRVPLSLAYPFVAVAMLIVPVIGWYFYAEQLSIAYWVGAAFVVVGMLIMQTSA